MQADTGVFQLQEHRGEWISLPKQPNVPHRRQWLRERENARHQGHRRWQQPKHRWHSRAIIFRCHDPRLQNRDRR